METALTSVTAGVVLESRDTDDFLRDYFSRKHTETDYIVPEGSRFAGSKRKMRQAQLPGKTFSGILERLETVSIPLLATSEGALEDGTTSGFCLSKGRQAGARHLVLYAA
jgi:hypothetical protein